jgi:glycosyltransferase involved in cell wall biosynthesis
MAARIPTVASNAGGIPEIVTSGRHALLVPPRAPEVLAAAIEQLLKDPQEAARLAESAFEETKRFTPEEYHRALVGIYQRVLDQPPGS